MSLPQTFQRLSFFIVRSVVVLMLGFLSRAVLAEQLTCYPCTLDFGTIVIGQSETLSTTLTNTQTTSVTISAMKTGNSSFQVKKLVLPLTLKAGKSASFDVVFSPRTNQWESGSITFTSNATDKTLTLSAGGVGVTSDSLTPSPKSLAFGNVSVGTTSTLPIVLTNTGTTNIFVTQEQLTGVEFAVSGLNLPVALKPTQTLAFKVTFTPQSATAASGNLVFPSGSVNVPLTGSGTSSSGGQLAFSPSTVNFGDVNVGSTGTRSMSVSATGADVTIASSSSSSSLFALSGASFPLTVKKGKSVSLDVAFTPKTSGSASGTLTFVSNASKSKATESLSGTGVTTKYSVNLLWNVSTSVVVGYNVYRSTSSTGSYSKINPTVDPLTAYTDSSVVSGKTYYYEATSVDSSGKESARTAPVSATVP